LARVGTLGIAPPPDIDPEMLRLENVDTDVPPPEAAVSATRDAVGSAAANSYLPFTGLPALRAAVAERLARQTGRAYDPDGEVVITSGASAGLLSALLAMVDPGDEVVVTDPTYPGLVNRARLAGAVVRQVPLRVVDGRWRTDPDALSAAVGPATRVLLLANPAMPTGLVLSDGEWRTVAEVCERTGAWLLYDAAMERILFDGIRYRHPAAEPELRERTVTVGTASKEYRMVGWRVGWVAGPRGILTDITSTVVYNTLVPSGFAQHGVLAALTGPDDGVAAAVAEWQRRRDTIVAQLAGYPLVLPDGGWSILLDATACGVEPGDLSTRLRGSSRVAATPMTAWGERVAPRYLRLVYSREPVARLATLRDRFESVL